MSAIGSTPAAGGDGVRLALLSNRLEAILRKMTNTLFRSARSGIINTGRDFSCCVISADDELLVTADSLPIQVVSGPETIAARMRELHPSLRAGDAFLHNSPYHGNSHAADHCVVVPVIDADGEHRLTVLVKAHVGDCGNSIPSSLMAAATDVYHEGALIFDCTRLQVGGEFVDDVLRLGEARIRAPELWLADIRAMVGAVRIGEGEILRLGAEVGWDQLALFVGEWLDYGEARMAEALASLPKGRATFSTALDALPGVCDEVPVNATVETHPEDGLIEVDLRDNVDTLNCGLNLTEATARASALIGILNGIPDPIPVNSGSLRRVRVHLREGCAIGIPDHPASCSLGTSHLAIRAINAVQCALAELGEGLGMAASGADIPAGAAAISGVDSRRDAPFVGLLLVGISAGAGSPWSDGWIGAEANTAGMMYSDSIEVDELLYPIRFWVNRIEPDTEGPGQMRGCPSIRIEWSPVDAPVTAIWIADGNQHAAEGARGGLAGGVSAQFVRHADGALDPLPACGDITLDPGQRLVGLSAGGGGYGDPAQRPPDRVRRDLAAGWITEARARDVYGLDDEARASDLSRGGL
jgi:N-methylhydantoinase B